MQEHAGRSYLRFLALRRGSGAEAGQIHPSSQELHKVVASLAIEAYVRELITRTDLKGVIELTGLDIGQFSRVFRQIQDQFA